MALIPTEPVEFDRDMLANDLATVLSDTHGIDVDSDDVKRGLDAFLKAIEPVKVPDATRRIVAFLDAIQPYQADEVAALDAERLLVSDLRALVRAVGTETNTRSLREKLTERGHLPRGVTVTVCPACEGSATVFDNVVQRHLKSSGLPCMYAGLLSDHAKAAEGVATGE